MNRYNAGVAVVAVCVGALLYAHRSGLHEIVMVTALVLVVLAGLCLFAAGWNAAAGGSKPAAQVRRRQPAGHPVVTRRPAAKPGDP